MNKIQLIINDELLSDVQDYSSSHLSKSVFLEVKKSTTQDRFLSEIINLVFSPDIAKNLIASAIWELGKFIWNEYSKKEKKSKKTSHLLIKMLDGRKFEYPLSLGESEVCKQIAEIPFDEIEFIRFK